MSTETVGTPMRHQPLLCHGKGRIKFGRNVQFGFFPSPDFLNRHCLLDARGETSEIEFQDNITINNGFTAIAEACRIHIGNRVFIGPNVTILDSDFHGLSLTERTNTNAVQRRDVLIGDDVFIGAGVTILKGVTIGNGSVIGAGSVVSKSVAENVIAGGNPAKTLRLL